MRLADRVSVVAIEDVTGFDDDTTQQILCTLDLKRSLRGDDRIDSVAFQRSSDRVRRQQKRLLAPRPVTSARQHAAPGRADHTKWALSS